MSIIPVAVPVSFLASGNHGSDTMYVYARVLRLLDFSFFIQKVLDAACKQNMSVVRETFHQAYVCC